MLIQRESIVARGFPDFRRRFISRQLGGSSARKIGGNHLAAAFAPYYRVLALRAILRGSDKPLALNFEKCKASTVSPRYPISLSFTRHISPFLLRFAPARPPLAKISVVFLVRRRRGLSYLAGGGKKTHDLFLLAREGGRVHAFRPYRSLRYKPHWSQTLGEPFVNTDIANILFARVFAIRAVEFTVEFFLLPVDAVDSVGLRLDRAVMHDSVIIVLLIWLLLLVCMKNRRTDFCDFKRRVTHDGENSGTRSSQRIFSRVRIAFANARVYACTSV